LVLTPPAPLVGELPVEVAVRDRRVVRVDYWLDGERVGSSNRAPFGTTISVGDRLRRRRLEARAFDRSGGLLARHAVHLNLPEAFFEISLLPPQRRDSEIVLEATPVVGRGRTIDRVEFRIGSEPAGTVRRPPYRVVIPADAGSFARAIAWDSTGDSREAFVFLDPATVSESVDVNLVEILVNVDDRDGRPIVDLRQEEFRIREKGSPRTVRSAKLLSTEPLLLGLAVDRSKSLYGVMDRVVSSALEFAARATRGGEIFVVGFDHRAEVLQWKTADADDVRRKLADLEASGNTALREAMLYSLMQYQNSSGNRILVVLTDGVDTSSRYDLDELERVAGEFAVPIYIVLFETTEGRGDAKRIAGLKRIAEMSGGRTFELASLDALDAIWRRIQLDVDTRYLLVYPTPLDPDAWRPVEVATGRNGSRVRAVKGLTPSISQ
ncbi:MAG: VWA domain-containing protein, partial [Thermoanaerobaculia bacterium]